MKNSVTNFFKKNNLNLALVFAAVLTVFTFGFKPAGVTPDKITICHIPPGNPGNCHEITISVNALQTHLDHHGDELVCTNQDELEYYQHLSAATHLKLRVVIQDVEINW